MSFLLYALCARLFPLLQSVGVGTFRIQVISVPRGQPFTDGMSSYTFAVRRAKTPYSVVQ